MSKKSNNTPPEIETNYDKLQLWQNLNNFVIFKTKLKYDKLISKMKSEKEKMENEAKSDGASGTGISLKISGVTNYGQYVVQSYYLQLYQCKICSTKYLNTQAIHHMKKFHSEQIIVKKKPRVATKMVQCHTSSKQYIQQIRIKEISVYSENHYIFMYDLLQLFLLVTRNPVLRDVKLERVILSKIESAYEKKIELKTNHYQCSLQKWVQLIQMHIDIKDITKNSPLTNVTENKPNKVNKKIRADKKSRDTKSNRKVKQLDNVKIANLEKSTEGLKSYQKASGLIKQEPAQKVEPLKQQSFNNKTFASMKQLQNDSKVEQINSTPLLQLESHKLIKISTLEPVDEMKNVIIDENHPIHKGVFIQENKTNNFHQSNKTTKQVEKKTRVKRVTEKEYVPDKHCGVIGKDNLKPCTRSLTCKVHNLSLRRAVPNRSEKFDTLLSRHKAQKELERKQKTVHNIKNQEFTPKEVTTISTSTKNNEDATFNQNNEVINLPKPVLNTILRPEISTQQDYFDDDLNNEVFQEIIIGDDDDLTEIETNSFEFVLNDVNNKNVLTSGAAVTTEKEALINNDSISSNSALENVMLPTVIPVEIVINKKATSTNVTKHTSTINKNLMSNKQYTDSSNSSDFTMQNTINSLHTSQLTLLNVSKTRKNVQTVPPFTNTNLIETTNNKQGININCNSATSVLVNKILSTSTNYKVDNNKHVTANILSSSDPKTNEKIMDNDCETHSPKKSKIHPKVTINQKNHEIFMKYYPELKRMLEFSVKKQNDLKEKLSVFRKTVINVEDLNKIFHDLELENQKFCQQKSSDMQEKQKCTHPKKQHNIVLNNHSPTGKQFFQINNPVNTCKICMIPTQSDDIKTIDKNNNLLALLKCILANPHTFRVVNSFKNSDTDSSKNVPESFSGDIFENSSRNISENSEAIQNVKIVKKKTLDSLRIESENKKVWKKMLVDNIVYNHVQLNQMKESKQSKPHSFRSNYNFGPSGMSKINPKEHPRVENHINRIAKTTSLASENEPTPVVHEKSNVIRHTPEVRRRRKSHPYKCLLDGNKFRYQI